MEDDGTLGAAATARLDGLLAAHPELAGTRPALIAAAGALLASWRAGGTLYLCGNGGSHADALHVAGELVKSFEGPRPLPPALRQAIEGGPYGLELAGALQAGLRAVTLGANGAVASAIANDIPLPQVGPAQELVALGRAGDVLVAISTSGESRSTVLAAAVARALGMTTVALVGRGRREAAGGELAGLADVAVVAPAVATAEVQGWHVRLYHCLCGMVEAELFA
jgi:D-sedoheptulose 7-phosphate isomerase